MTFSTQTREEILACLNAVTRKPLYLDPQRTTQVGLEGPALRIVTEGRAALYIPMRRISRIVANERTRWNTDAILACAERSISILVLSGDGTAAARILGRPGERQELRQRLLDILERPDWKILYKGWIYAIERQLLIKVQRKLLGPDDRRTPTQMKHWVNREAVRCSDSETASRMRHWLNELTIAWMLNHCQQLGIGAQSELLADGWPDVPGDLARILCWETETLRIGWLRRRNQWAVRHGRPLRPVTRRSAIRLFEQHGARIGRAGRELTNRLHYWLVELA